MYADETRLNAARRRGAMAVLFAMATAGSILPGCSGSGRAAPVDPSRAREALNTALESWKKGEPIDALKTASPPIVAQDFDWMGGQKLVGFEVTGEGKDDDANLRIPVRLTLRTPQGKEVKKSVSYVVGTSPSLTVFRDF
ncbi:MAG: hypothetical protein U0835_27500 [Isosphaeraceae bacterium]